MLCSRCHLSRYGPFRATASSGTRDKDCEIGSELWPFKVVYSDTARARADAARAVQIKWPPAQALYRDGLLDRPGVTFRSLSSPPCYDHPPCHPSNPAKVRHRHRSGVTQKIEAVVMVGWSAGLLRLKPTSQVADCQPRNDCEAVRC